MKVGIEMLIGIVTLFDTNLGNRLQNYAGEQILQKFGYETKTLVFSHKTEYKFLLKYYVKKISRYSFSGNKLFWRYEKKRREIYNDFNLKYINVKYLKIDANNTKKYLRKFNKFVVGSDQVWNPNLKDKLEKNQFFLQFADYTQKVCLSPSIGVEKILDEDKDYFIKQLNTFRYLSIRERKGADLIWKLTGKVAEVLIDPTMMLSKNQWKVISKQPNNIVISKEYILTYFLGGCSQSQKDYIKYIADEFDLTVIDLIANESKEYYFTGPEEFVYLIENAKIIMTDSFHACVFSILFEKPFQVFKRNGNLNNMYSRIESLLKLLKLEHKQYEYRENNNLFDCNYEVSFKILRRERQKFSAYLKKALLSSE